MTRYRYEAWAWTSSDLQVILSSLNICVNLKRSETLSEVKRLRRSRALKILIDDSSVFGSFKLMLASAK